MRLGATLLFALLVSTPANAQVDTAADGSTEPSAQSTAPVRNKTTAERISSPNPTTKGVPWSFPLF
ncbi:MAG: hypothetical protein WBN29_13925, partial [Polyangiales bacterium]